MMSVVLYVRHKVVSGGEWYITDANVYRLRTPTRLPSAVSLIVVRDKNTTMYYGTLPAMCKQFSLNQLTKVNIGWDWTPDAPSKNRGI